MIYLCCDKQRRLRLREENDRRRDASQTLLNGIDYLEVLDRDAPESVGGIERQNTLLVRLLAPPALTRENVRINGGERITPVEVVWAHLADVIPPETAPADERSFFAELSEPETLLVVRTDSTGDYSRYRLSLVRSPSDPAPLDDFDPLFSVIEFSFKVECPSDFDCEPRHVCPPEPEAAQAINYLAKDYASFRRLMLDRMSLHMPSWHERNAADLGITLVELLAYVADRLSYQQDATATEAYLDTARRRISVRRLVRLVDCFMHDGCNARAWVRIQCAEDTAGVALPAGTPLLTKVVAQEPVLALGSRVLEEVMRQRPVVFETMYEVTLFAEHTAIPFYTWGDERCCLPKGATRATLHRHLPNLEAGDVLVFVEIVNPRTGSPDDADPTRRHAVRLTEVHALEGGEPLTDPLTGEEITQIAWDAMDALPFPFCVSSITDPEHAESAVTGVSEAWGNIVLADHGQSVFDEELGVVPESRLFRRGAESDRCGPHAPQRIPPRFRPTLERLPVTQACPFDSTLPATRAVKTSPADARPAIRLRATGPGGEEETWEPQQDLLNSDASATEFVAEVERDGTTFLRFGDGRHGRRPVPGTSFTAERYRVGNGSSGNIGADALFHVVTNVPEVVAVRNPLPASGGADPETPDEVRQRAPYAFRTQERAVTEADYGTMAERNPRIQRAAAMFRWTGSWYTVFVTADPRGGPIAADEERRAFEQDTLEGLEQYRMAGYDLEAEQARHVPLEIEMHVCVKPDYFRSDVHGELLATFSNSSLPDGRRGVFHPDNFTLGQPVYLSPLYAAAQAVSGVASVQVTTFQRQRQPSPAGLRQGKLPIDRLEIARCDNDPNFVEHGVVRMTLEGGK